MPRTRSTNPRAKSKTEKETSTPAPETRTSTTKPLPPATANPPKLFVLPKDTSSSSRIITLQYPATSTPSRYLFNPEKDTLYEFTRIAAPPKSPKSWLITSENGDVKEQETQSDTTKTKGGMELGSGYIAQTPSLFLATPIDILFLVLPALAPKNAKDTKQHFLSLDDHLDTLYISSPHLRHVISQNASFRSKIGKRMAACCDTVDAGDEVMYRLSLSKLLRILVQKAQRMLRAPFPLSMEEKFVKPALEIPVMSVKREESSVSIVTDVVSGTVVADDTDTQGTTATTTAASQTTTTAASQTTTTQKETQDTTLTAPSDVPSDTPEDMPEDTLSDTPTQSLTTPPEIPALLRLRTALNYLIAAYIPPTLHPPLRSLLSACPPASSPSSQTTPTPSLPNFSALDSHLSMLSKLKVEATALRSISDNISRKRGYADDDEKIAEREEKKRKKEEEEKKKKGESRGIKALKKVDTSGMKKLSSFFTRSAAKK